MSEHVQANGRQQNPEASARKKNRSNRKRTILTKSSETEKTLEASARQKLIKSKASDRQNWSHRK